MFTTGEPDTKARASLQTQAPTLFNSTKRNPVVLHNHVLSLVQDVLPNLIPKRCHVCTWLQGMGTCFWPSTVLTLGWVGATGWSGCCGWHSKCDPSCPPFLPTRGAGEGGEVPPGAETPSHSSQQLPSRAVEHNQRGDGEAAWMATVRLCPSSSLLCSPALTVASCATFKEIPKIGQKKKKNQF